MNAALQQKQMQPELAVIEQLRIQHRGIDPRKLAIAAGVPVIQYLQALEGDRQLSASQLESLTKALTTFTGDAKRASPPRDTGGRA